LALLIKPSRHGFTSACTVLLSGEEVTLKIWKMNIETAKQLFEEKQKDVEIKDEDIIRFARKDYRKMEDSGLCV